MAFQILDSVLQFAVRRFVQLFDDLCSSRFHFLEVHINIIDKNRERLSAIATCSRANPVLARTCKLDPGLTQTHLRAIGQGSFAAITIVLRKTKNRTQPGYGGAHICIDQMREQDVRGNRSIVNHGLTIH